MKRLKYLVNSTPTTPELGYGDHWEIHIDGKVVDGGHGSTCPNPYRLINGRDPVPWTHLYGWIADGIYRVKCIMHPKYGKCLMVNDTGVVQSRVKNPVHGGQMMLTHVYVHCGSLESVNPKWRGSRGCPTVAPDEWDRCMSYWQIGEVGELEIGPHIVNHC